MTHTKTNTTARLLALTGILVVVNVGWSSDQKREHERQFSRAPLGSAIHFAPPVQAVLRQSSPELRQAVRLQARIRSHGSSSPPLERIMTALAERRTLQSRRIAVTLQPEDDKTFDPWVVSLHRYPLWLRARITPSTAAFALSTESIRDSLEREAPGGLPSPHNITIHTVTPDTKNAQVLRATTDGIARAGYTFDTEEAVRTLHDALAQGTEQVTLNVWRVHGKAANATDQDLGTLELIASGQSNFIGSPAGRVANIRKGLAEHMNNILIPPAATFSFNSILGPVTKSAGWQEALGIFNMGAELRPVAGGGICQVATTVYRGLVNAGFPVIERRNHSLYVGYYEKYGVGIDSTIFPGHQDLVFVNDTPSFLLIQAYADGYDAYVNIFGTNDGRAVTLEGPYFASTAPEDLRVNNRKLSKSEIVWIQRVEYANGSVLQNAIVSRYKELPKNIVAKFGQTTLHAAGNG